MSTAPTIPQNAPLVYVVFSAEINQTTTEGLLSVLAMCANSKAKQVCLALSTSGGQVMNGINLFHVMKGMPFELIIHNVGNVDSIGNVVFLAGARRYASPNATFMFHGIGFPAPPSGRLEEKDCRERLEGILADQTRMSNIIATQCPKLPAEEIADFFKQAQTKDAQFALEKGLIHEIKEFQISPGCPTMSLVFQRQPIQP